MYLLTTDTYRLIKVERDLRATPAYAILSHRWGSREITFDRCNPAIPDNAALITKEERNSAAKIRNACAVAKQQNLSYLWIDTVCIDKSSSEELREALNSMFAYYHNADVCYTYLSDVTMSSVGDKMFDSDLPDRQKDGKQLPSNWFERGWTLQELLAPRKMVFYDKTWQSMGTRNDLATLVGRAASVSPSLLTDAASEQLKFRQASIATKMSWMAGRVTTRPEDIAYSLLGILDINMIPQYGEGIKAFSRLQEILLSDSASFDESLFAWALPSNGELKCYRKQIPSTESTRLIETVPIVDQGECGLLAPSPDCFRECGDLKIVYEQIVSRPLGGFQRTHQGINLALPLRVTKKTLTGLDRKEISLALNCWRGTELVVLHLIRNQDRTWSRVQADRVQSNQDARVANNRRLGIDQGSAGLSTITIRQPQTQIKFSS